MKNKFSVMLEEGYQTYLNELAVGDKKAAGRKVTDKVEVGLRVCNKVKTDSIAFTPWQGSYRYWKALEFKSHISRPGKSWNQA